MGRRNLIWQLRYWNWILMPSISQHTREYSVIYLVPFQWSGAMFWKYEFLIWFSAILFNHRWFPAFVITFKPDFYIASISTLNPSPSTSFRPTTRWSSTPFSSPSASCAPLLLPTISSTATLVGSPAQTLVRTRAGAENTWRATTGAALLDCKPALMPGWETCKSTQAASKDHLQWLTLITMARTDGECSVGGIVGRMNSRVCFELDI